MTLEMAGGNEFGHHRLGADLRMAHVQRPAPGEGLGQRRRQHQVAQAQRREGDLAEGADVDHPPLPIQRCQWRQRSTAVTVLAVVVVLDYPAIAALGPFQQLQAPRQRQGDARGVLVRGRDIDQPAILQPRQRGAVQAIVIHRHAAKLRASHGEGMAGSAIAGVLDGDPVAGLHQQLGAEADGLLGAAGDHHLRRIAGQPAAAAQVGGHQLAQAHIAGRVAITQARRRRLAPEARREARPGLEGKQVERRHANAEGPWRPRHRRRQVVVAKPLQRRARRRAGGARKRRAAGAGQFGHIGAVADPALHIALGIKLVEGTGHGVARDPQQRRKVAAGRQARATAQATIEDALAQGLVELARQALPGVQADAGKVDGKRWRGRHDSAPYWTYRTGRKWILQQSNILPSMEAFRQENHHVRPQLLPPG
ncbi:hypothetical protein D3C85_729670 [compost metagenome]